MKHTQGPWKVVSNERTRCGQCHQIKKDDDVSQPIACLWEGGGTKGKPRQIANAKLIAAAPDLLKACKEAEKMCIKLLVNASLDMTPYMKKLANAIAKAEGE